MSRKALTEEEMSQILGEEKESTEKSEKDLLEEQEMNERPIDEIPAGVHLLKKSIVVDDHAVNEISYDLERLTPIQYINLVKRLSKKRQIPVPEVDMELQIAYFALASEIPVTVLKSQLSTSDYTQICGLVRTFLLGASTEELEE